MLILFDGARRVNPARPFALGLLPPEPAPAGPPVTDADVARLDDAADEALGGDVQCDPEFWPEWTDFHHFEPTFEDRAEWAAECARIESARDDHDADAHAAESAAVDAMERGLIPPDVAATIARTSLVGHDA